jgi:hypothetical protein
VLASVLLVTLGSAPVEWAPAPAPPEACETWTRCADPYLLFPHLALEHGSLMTEAEVEAELRAATAAPQDDAPIDDDDLALLIRAATGTSFLFDEVDDVPLWAAITEERDVGVVREEVVVLDDPWVGSFQARLLLPHGAGPFPAVLALPGHCDSSESYARQSGGDAWVRDGFALLILDHRSDEADELEDWVARHLLVHGFSLMGLRLYEAMVATRYLRARPEVDAEHVGLVGHSGGSAVGNLLIRLDDRYGAYVSDMVSHYDSRSQDDLWLCDTNPALARIDGAVSQLQRARVPTMNVPYAYEDRLPAMRAWMARWLR